MMKLATYKKFVHSLEGAGKGSLGEVSTKNVLGKNRTREIERERLLWQSIFSFERQKEMINFECFA